MALPVHVTIAVSYLQAAFVVCCLLSDKEQLYVIHEPCGPNGCLRGLDTEASVGTC